MVRIVVGDHDMIKIEHTVALFHAIPESRLWIVPGSSHMVPNERAPLFNSVVADFFSAH
ncbi:MAG: hypothetical protein JO257_23530 [Deltaproteobacteria bacterium]|nr:hypothetical protein [Deltaproteobacteria bacterium]